MDLKDLKQSNISVSYWWFVGKNELINILLFKLKLKENSKILNIGCGTGDNNKVISKYGNLILLDKSKKALNFLDNVQYKLVHANAESLPFEKESMDTILMFDVLEHIKNDKKSIKENFRVLKKNGYLILTIPALPFLYSFHDEFLNHYRRYSKKNIYNLVNPYFEIIKISYWNFFLFFPIAIIRILKKLIHFGNPNYQPLSDLNQLPLFINKLFISIIKFENKLFKKNFYLPIGISLILILKKKKAG